MVQRARPIIAFLFVANLLFCGTEDEIQDIEAYNDAEIVEINDALNPESGEHAETAEFSEVSDTGDVQQEYYVTFPLKLKTKCKSKSDCVNVCGTGDCIEETCQFMPKQNYCILKDSDESTYCFKPMMSNAKFDCLFCNPLFHQLEWTSLVFASTFEDGDSKGMVVYDLTGGGIVWTISSLKSGSGNYSLYFGDPSTGTYSNGKHVAASVISPSLQLPSEAATSLRFSLYLDTEQTKGYDIFKVNLVSGETKEEIFNSDSINGTTSGVFIPVEIDLGKWAGSDVKIEFVFDSIDSGINSFEGAYIDDIVIKTHCCGTDGDCNDFNPCTSDECAKFGGECKNVKKEKCCANLLDCDDGDPCTKDTCPSPGGECQHDKIEGCCNGDGDCDDNNSCTEDLCVISNNKCLYKPICCTTDGDCKVDDKCLKGKCEDWACVYVDICCKSDSDCDDNEKCTIDFCKEGDCVHKPANLPGCCYPEIFSDNFDSGDGNFTFSPPVNDIGWQIISGGKSTSSPMSLYYGNPATKKYATGSANSGSAKTLQPIKIPEGLESSISFNLYMDTDSGDYSDILTLNVTAGDKTSSVWKKGYDISMKKFQKIVVDISEFGGLEIFLEFFFDTGYTYWEKYGEGVYIDDIEVVTTCEKKQCANSQDCLSKYTCKYGSCNEGFCNYVESCCYSNDECDDADICTTDSCLNGKCSFVQVKGCCKSDFDCNDGNPCTLDLCSGFGGQCSNPAITGCCLKNADCDDKDNCTKDLCLENGCVHQYLCCQDDAECDDNDDICTTDKCVGGFCKYTLTGAEGCCKQEIYYADFNGGDLNGIELSPPSGGVGWQVISSGKSVSSPWSLYYGNPTTKNFDNGTSNSGIVQLPEILLPQPGLETFMKFQLYMDTEQGMNYDLLKLYFNAGGKDYLVWDKSKLDNYYTFNEITLNITAFAGIAISPRFEFNTVDSLANNGEGIYLDDIEFITTCIVKECFSDSDCKDSFNFTTEKCEAGSCVYELGSSAIECYEDWDCDDYDWCTYDYCVAGKCVNEWDPWC